MAIAPRTNQQRIRALAIAIIFFALLTIASFVVSTVNLIRLRSQTTELKRLAEAAASQAAEAKRIGDTVVANQEVIKQIALDAKRTSDAIEACTIPEGQCFKDQQARDEAVVKGVVGGVSAVNRRLISRDVKKVEQTAQTQGEATRAVVEEKAEQVKEVVVDNPPGPAPAPCALELGTVALLCTVEPKAP